jgi:hypothetical protein
LDPRIERLASVPPRRIGEDRREQPSERERRGRNFQSVLGAPPSDPQETTASRPTAAADLDAGVRLDEEPGRIVDFAA